MTAIRRCDHCGAISDEKSWPRLYVPTGARDEDITLVSFGLRLPRVDLCSWECVSGYATLKMFEEEAAS